MSEFDGLIAVDGVLTAGQFGPDGRIAEYKADSWCDENPDGALVLRCDHHDAPCRKSGSPGWSPVRVIATGRMQHAGAG